MRLKSIFTSILGASLVCLSFWFIRLYYIDPFGDPDLFFHFQISKLWATSGRPEVLPAFDLIGWSQFFTDKEFLFHWFTRWGWVWNQERGVILTAIGFSFLTLFLLSYFSQRRIGVRLGLFCSIVIGLGSFHFLNRIAMVRPQTLAILLYSFILLAWVYRSRVAILFFTFLYTLAYHLVAVPLALFFFILVLDWKSKESRKLAAFGILGVVAGFILNPYFPGNVLVSLQVLKIPFLISSGEKINFGAELWPQVSSSYFLIVAGILAVVYGITRITIEYRVLCAQVLLLIALRAFNPRAIEYLVPTFWVLAVLGFEKIKSLDRRLYYRSVAAFTLLMGLSAWSNYREVSFKNHTKQSIFAEPVRRSLQPLIHAAQAKESNPNRVPQKTRIFHCEWDQSPYVWYAGLKDVKLVDLLDPTFLLVKAPEIYRLRQNIIKGIEDDPVSAITSVFDADWVFCRAGPLLDFLSGDPRVIRVPGIETPKTGRALHIQIDRSTHYVQNWLVSDEVDYSTAFLATGKGHLESYAPLPKKWLELKRPTQENVIEKNRVLFPLKSIFSEKKSIDKTNSYRCVWLKPTPEWLKQNAGSDLLGWGVGGHIRIWKNERPLYKQEGSHDFAKMIDGFIPLDSKLGADDRLEILFCSESVENSKISLSAWNRSELDRWCLEQDRIKTPSWDRVSGWQYVGESRGNCIAPYSIPLNTR